LPFWYGISGILDCFQFLFAIYDTNSTASKIKATKLARVRKKNGQSGGVRTSFLEAPTLSRDEYVIGLNLLSAGHLYLSSITETTIIFAGLRESEKTYIPLC